MTITKTRAIELLEKAVEKNGADYVDPNSEEDGGCTYANGDQPGCIVGTAFFLAGAPIDQIAKMDGDLSQSIDALADYELPEELTSAARRVFTEAQSKQDRGHSWGEALEVARFHADDLRDE